MDQRLKAAFTSDEIALAAQLGASSTSLSDRVVDLFAQLTDPLLSAEEVHALLGISESLQEVIACLGKLEGEASLEKSARTVRPHDPEGLVLYRRTDLPFARLKLVAIEADLGADQTRYQFTCDGRLIRSLARVDRLDSLTGVGVQRDEVKSHVEQISQGIMSGTQVPNSVLLVLLESQTSEPTDENDSPPASFVIVRPLSDWITVGLPGHADFLVQRFRQVELDFPFRRAAFDDEKSAILVDGQQRTAGLSLVDVDAVPHFALSVNAVVASVEDAKRVFQVANTTVKISTQFSRALLATMEEVPGYLRTEQTMAVAHKLLAIDDESSPFVNLVQYAGVRRQQKPKPPIVYNSLFQVLSIFADSGLPLEDPKALAAVVAKAFKLVKETWPEAWGKRPTDSKLMHGVGLRSMASLLTSKLESLVDKHKSLEPNEVWIELEKSLKRLKPRIVWTDAEAADASNAVKKIWRESISGRQNTTQDIAALSSFLKKESLSLDVKA
jgi:DGQHR domain-containing protein